MLALYAAVCARPGKARLVLREDGMQLPCETDPLADDSAHAREVLAWSDFLVAMNP